MKKIFRRIYLDIIRKPLSFISKIAVFAVLFSLLFTSLVIKSISKNMQTDFFDKMKIYVSITSNINDIQFQSNSSQSYLTQFEDYYKMINKLSKNENILFHDLNISTNNHYFPLKFIEVSPETNTISFIYPHSNSLENNEIEQYAQCLLNEKVCFYPTLPLRSVQNVEFLDLRFNSIDVPIVSDNRTFTQTEIDEGENVCLVPYGYSLYTYENGNLSEKILKNGDIIYISEFVKDNQGKYLYVKKHEFKIIGFYNQTESGEIYNQSFYSINPIYVPEKALIPLLETSLNQTKKLNPSDYDILFNSSYNSMFIHPVIFQLNDIEGLKTFLKDFETNCSYDDYKLFSTVSSSLITISNIRSVSNSFNYISIISLAVCILISIMVLLIDISHRRNEIGILLSFGAKKKHIIGQYILELLMTSVISMIISLFLTFGLTKITTNFLFETTQQNSASNILLESTLEETNTTEITDFELTDETWRIILIYIALILSSEIVVIKIYIEKVSLKELLNGE